MLSADAVENEGESTALFVRSSQSCVLQSRRRNCCRCDGYWTKQSIGRCVMWPSPPHVGKWVGSSGLPSLPGYIDPPSSGWTLGLSVRPKSIVTDCWRRPTVKSPVEMCPSSTRRYYADQYKPAGGGGVLTVLKMHYTPWRQRRQFPASFARGAGGHSLRGANVDIRRKCHGRCCHVTTVPSLTVAAAAVCPMTLLNGRSLNYHSSLEMLRQRPALRPAQTFIS